MEVSVCHELTLFVCQIPFGTDYEILGQDVKLFNL